MTGDIDMRHFEHISKEDREKIFMKQPESFTRYEDREKLSYALGATIYMPALRPGIAKDIIGKKHRGVQSMVICLEDAVGELMANEAQDSLLNTLSKVDSALANGSVLEEEMPLIFVRVRQPDQIERLAKKAGEKMKILSGIVFPKFSKSNAIDYMHYLERANEITGASLYAMPILESRDIINWDTRKEALSGINGIVDENREKILSLRIGATDFSGYFGIRRSHDTTVYDIHIIRDCITDIVNNFCRPERDFAVSGPVWEYFSGGDRVLKPQLRMTPFKQAYGDRGEQMRCRLIDEYIDGLIHEVILDRANGLVGKTVIHPSHIAPVQAMQCVTHEEYMDALSIMENSTGSVGVVKSSYSNKMNEIKPHSRWAKKILRRASIYGVLNSGYDFASLI